MELLFRIIHVLENLIHHDNIVNIEKYLEVNLLEKSKKIIVIAFSIFLETALFCFWLLIALGAHKLAEYVHDEGVQEIFADIFKWTSSFSTLLYTLLYIAKDLKEALEEFRGTSGGGE